MRRAVRRATVWGGLALVACAAAAAHQLDRPSGPTIVEIEMVDHTVSVLAGEGEVLFTVKDRQGTTVVATVTLAELWRAAPTIARRLESSFALQPYGPFLDASARPPSFD